LIYKHLPLKIKWPNDIFYNNQFKLGGVLVKSSLLGSLIQIKIGVGFNLSNQHPTESLNKILRANGMPEWSSELFLARFLTHFEHCVHLLDNSARPEALHEFLNDFQDHWMHR
jgi:biotin--protein ligase